MFRKNLKLICAAIGLVVVLMMGLVVPGATQQNPFTREDLVQLINRVFAPTLSASEGDIWDTQCSEVYSSPFVTFTLIPLHPTSRSLQRLLVNDLEMVPLFNLYLHDDGESQTVVKRHIPPGIYTVKLKSATEVVFIDQDGKEVLSGKVRINRSTTPRALYLPCFPGEANIAFNLNVTPQLGDIVLQQTLEGKIKVKYRKCLLWCLFEVEVEVEIDSECRLGDSLAARHLPIQHMKIFTDRRRLS